MATHYWPSFLFAVEAFLASSAATLSSSVIDVTVSIPSSCCCTLLASSSTSHHAILSRGAWSMDSRERVQQLQREIIELSEASENYHEQPSHTPQEN